MQVTILSLPSRLDNDGALHLVRTLDKHLLQPELAVDFQSPRFVFPFGTLLAAEAMKEFVAVRSQKGLETNYVNAESLTRNSPAAIGYLKFFGFFKYCAIPIGDEPNKRSREHYVPIQVLSSQDLVNRAHDRQWQSTIEKHCEELACLVSNGNSYVESVLEYAFREIIRNVFEHSGRDTCSVMGQYYPKLGFVEVAVADRGMGIAGSLASVDQSADPVGLLELSLEPGISRVDASSVRDDEWGNTGFGLYVLSQTGKEYGQFAILSNGAYLKLYEDDKRVLFDRTFFDGTVVQFTIYLPNIEYFPNFLKATVDRGEEAYFKKCGVRKRASGRSKKSLRNEAT